MIQRKIIEYVFLSLLSAMGSFGIGYLRNISDALDKLTKSDSEFNLKIGLMTEKLVEASESLKDHEFRIRKIERTE